MVITKVNDTWRAFDKKGGGYVSWVKSRTRSGAARQLRKGIVP